MGLCRAFRFDAYTYKGHLYKFVALEHDSQDNFGLLKRWASLKLMGEGPSETVDLSGIVRS